MASLGKRFLDKISEWKKQLGEEWSVLLNPVERDARLVKWREHVARYEAIANGKGKSVRIDFTAGHLDILDRKFAFLLQFQALLSGLIALAINALKPETFGQAGTLGYWLLVFLVAGFGLWLANTLLCLSGVRRVTWGDLYKYDENTAQAEHVDELLKEVIKRTAKFRIAVSITVGSILLVTVLAILAGIIAYQSLRRGDTGSMKSITVTCTTCPSPSPCCPPATTPIESTFEITNPVVYTKGHVSHSHTFLLNKQTGEIWEMTCRKGKTVEFRAIPRSPYTVPVATPDSPPQGKGLKP